jgi:hypothetical protein
LLGRRNQSLVNGEETHLAFMAAENQVASSQSSG